MMGHQWLIPTSFFVQGVTPDAIRGYSSIPGPAYNAFIALFAMGAGSGLYKTVLARKASAGLRRTQLTYVLLALSFVVAGGISYFLLNLGIKGNLPPIDNLLVIAFTSIIAYAVVRHRLMDVHLAITRAAVFAVVYTAFLGIPLFVALNWQLPTIHRLGDRWWVWLWLGSSLLTALAYHVNLYFQKQAASRLTAQQRRYQSVLRQAAQEIPLIRQPDALLDRLGSLLVQTEGPRLAVLYAWNPNTQRYDLQGTWGTERSSFSPSLPKDNLLANRMSQTRGPIFLEELLAENSSDETIKWKASGISLAVPCLSKDRPSGLLLIGEKSSKRNYTPEDIAVLFVLATQVGLALENFAYIEEIRLTHEQLRQSDRQAMAGKLAAAVAHEVKQPLTAIKTFVEELEVRGDDAEFRKQFHSTVGRELAQMEKTARELMNLARPRPPQYRNLPLTNLLSEIAEFLGPECRRRGVDLKMETDGNPRIDADPDQLHQMVVNLVLNSLDAMETVSWTTDRPKNVTIRSAAEGDKVLLEVRDSGCGIHPTAMDRMFEPFYTTKDGGGGLGLAIVRQIVEAHQGTIRVDSKYGQGTTIAVHLPIH